MTALHPYATLHNDEDSRDTVTAGSVDDYEPPGAAVTVQLGQTYRAANPLDEGRRILVASRPEGHDFAWVCDAVTRLRPRTISLRSLHASPTTKAGQPRRTGYVLEQPDGSQP